MEEENFKKIMNDFYSFKQRLINKIKGDYVPSNEEECYIINETWNNKLEEFFNQYKNIKEKNSSNYLFEYNLLINKGPEIIPNFTKMISHIYNKKKFEIFSKSLYDKLYIINDLNNFSNDNAKYYAGNNKLIIEFQGKDEDKALLLIDPLGKDKIKKMLFIILISNIEKERKLLLYKDLISFKNTNDIFENINYSNSIIPFEKYINNIKQRTLNIKKDFKKDIIKSLIYIFYYEKSLNINENIFNVNQQYYLINPEWLKKFKEYFNYQNLYKLLIKDPNYNNLKFNQLQSQIENIINVYINKNIINIENRKLNEYLANVNNIKVSLINKGQRITNYYIIHSSNIDIIKPYLSINEEIAFEPINLFTKENKIFFYYKNNIIIGNINEKHIFTSSTIICYKSLNILNKEKNIFLKHSINKYIAMRKCKKNNLILINENNEELGELFQFLDKNKNTSMKKPKIYKIEISNKNRAYSSQQTNSNNNNNMKLKLNQGINIKIRNFSNSRKENSTNSKSYYNGSISSSKEKTVSIHSKDKKPSKNNSFYINHKQNDFEANIRVFPNKSKEKNNNNSYFNRLIYFSNKGKLNIANDLKKKEKELKKQVEIDNNLKIQNNLLLEKNKKLEKNEENLKQNILKIKNELNQKQQELEIEKNSNEVSKLKREELMNNNNNYLNQINYLDKEIKEKNNEINELKNKNKENEDKIKKEYEKLIEKQNNEIKNLKQNEWNNKNKEEKDKEEIIKNNKLLNEENNSLKNEIINSKKIIEQLQKEKNEINKKIKEKDDEYNKIIKLNKEYEDKINEMKNKNKELELNNCNIKKDLEEKTKKINEFKVKEDELNNMNKITEELQKKIKQLESDNNIKEQKIKSLEKNIEELKEKENKKIKEYKIEKLETGIQIFPLEKEKTESSNKEKENENKDNKNNDDLNNEYKELLKQKEEEISKLKEENKKIIKNQEKNNEAKNQNQNDIDNFKNQIKDLKKYIKDLKNKNNEEYKKREDELSLKDNELKNREKELEKKNSDIKNLEQEINKKISFLEDKENLLDNEYKNIEKEKEQLQQKSIDNSKLQKEYDNLKIKYLDLMKNTNNKKSVKNSFSTDEKKCVMDKNKNAYFAQYNNYIDNNILNISGSRGGKEPLKEYESPTLVGLNNIGATCFMNSTLQCLSQTKGLTNYFLNERNEEKIINNNIALKNKNDLQLSPVYHELIKILWKKDGEKSFSPNKFMNIVNNMNPLFKTGQAGDAKDFIIFVLEQIHKELKKSVNVNKSQNLLPLNQYDKNNAFNYFFNDFQKECSIISDIFFGFTETTNECINCRNKYNSQGIKNPICYNYGIFNCLIFPLEEVKNMKNNSMQNNNIQINNNRVSIYECFYYNQKSDYFTGDNRNYCNICKQLFDSIYTSKIFISPNVLVLILNRGKGNIYDVKLDFSESIDITQFIQQRDCPQLIYNLYGVITHIGESGPNAHFVASCKSPIDDKWYRYNDAFVNPITNFQKEVIEFGTPYILFYQKNNS